MYKRQGCDQAADYLCQCGASLVSGAERAKIAEALAAFEEANPDAVRPEAIEPLLLGIASHHAGLLPGWKGLVERLFQRGLLKVVFATETLAAGVNMPARSSVLSCLSKRDDSGPRALTSNEFMQMAGRAGRRGYQLINKAHVRLILRPKHLSHEAFVRKLLKLSCRRPARISGCRPRRQKTSPPHASVRTRHIMSFVSGSEMTALSALGFLNVPPVAIATGGPNAVTCLGS